MTETISRPATGGAVRTTGVALRVDGLRVSFVGAVGRPAVDDVSFSVRRGEVLAVVGESGSGKTVTARALLGLLPPSATVTGRVTIGDTVIDPGTAVGDDRAWHGIRGRRIAMVFQEPQTALNPVRTVGWQLAEALRAHGTPRAEARERALELLALVGLPEPARRARSYPHELSGGQKQRVVIALALANDPEVLVADEPTTALDVTVQAEILALLGELRDRLGTAVVLITHNMGVVADLADRVLVLRGGRMVEQGEVVALFTAPFTAYARALLAAVPRLPVQVGEPAPGTSAVDAEPPVLRFDAVTVDYPGHLGRAGFRALTDVSLTLPAGRVLGVVGESGSGKTTLAKAAVGALAAGAGTITVAGADLATTRGRALRELRSRLGVVHQDPATTLDPLLTVGDSIAEPLLVHRVLRGRALRSRVAELLHDVALPAHVAGRRPGELSGGQRQRVALARALALRPALLIADEPTSALDVTVQAQILRLFGELQIELGFACVFISHDLAVVDQVSDQVLVLRDGVVVESGPTGRVLVDPQAAYTRALVAAVPLPDPVEQRARRG